MLAEIRDLRAHTNISMMKHQEEREKMSEQLSTIEDQTTKKERQAKRQGNSFNSLKSYILYDFKSI